MKALKVMATLNEQGQLTLDHPLIFDQNCRDQNRRVEVIVLIQDETDPEENAAEDQTNADLLADFRQAWQEAMTGQTIPVAQLWEGLEDD